MDESSGKSAFSIGLTFRVRNRNLMRAFQPRFVIRAEWSKFVRAHPRRAAWKVKSLALREWGTGAAGSVSGLDTVEHEWSCHQVLRRASRDFHSSKYVTQTDLKASCWNERREEEAVNTQRAILQSWLQGWTAPASIVPGDSVSSFVN